LTIEKIDPVYKIIYFQKQLGIFAMEILNFSAIAIFQTKITHFLTTCRHKKWQINVAVMEKTQPRQ